MWSWLTKLYLSDFINCTSVRWSNVFLLPPGQMYFSCLQVRFWTMRVATEIGEKRVAHSQSKEQEGMVPLKVWNWLCLVHGQLFLKKNYNIRWSQETLLFVRIGFYIFLCFFESWLLAIPSSECGAKFWKKFAAFKLANLIRPRPK